MRPADPARFSHRDAHFAMRGTIRQAVSVGDKPKPLRRINFERKLRN